MTAVLVGLTALLGLYMAWNIGANDVANSMADAVGSRALSVRRAVIAASICEFAGAVLVGAHVTDTVRKGIVDPTAIGSMGGTGEGAAILVLGMAAALLAAGMWLNVATWLGMPVSTTHSIVGAVAGFGIAAAGWDCVNWNKMGQIVASWFISPIAGGFLAFTVFRLMSAFIIGGRRPVLSAVKGVPVVFFFMTAMVTLSILYKGLGHIISGDRYFSGKGAFMLAIVSGLLAAAVSRYFARRALAGKQDLPLEEQLKLVERIFVPAVIFTSCSVAFAHGANDVANSVGPLAAVAHILRGGAVAMEVPVPLWILTVGGGGIVLGLATYGYRVMHTVGTQITELTPSRGVAADVAATITVLACSRLKLPVSTTHTLVGAILGIGMARGLGAVNGRVARNIFSSWFVTVPAAMAMSMIFFVLGKAFFLTMVISLIVGE